MAFVITFWMTDGPTVWPANSERSYWLTPLVGLLAIFVAYVGWYRQYPIVFAASVGALGGLAHELAQSQGLYFFPEKTRDSNGGVTTYLGTLAGMILGIVAGVLAVQGSLVPPNLVINATINATANATINATAGAGSAPIVNYSFGYTAFLAGLGLKGVAEAATTTVTAPSKTYSASDNQKPGADGAGKDEDKPQD